MRSIDLNSDLGEGMPTDPEVMRYVSSANVACGGHAGDSETMRRTILLAQERGVSVGAHPGYPDRDSFGRRALDLPTAVLGAALRAQLGTLAAIAESVGARLRHVKAHGALYNRGERDPAIAEVLARAVAEFDPELLLFCPPRSAMAASATSHGLSVAREGFCDRAYEADGTLRSRALPGALVTDPRAAADQGLRLASSGEYDTLCVHGDTPSAPLIVAEVRRTLAAAGIRVAPFAIAATR